MQKLARACYRHRRIVLAVWILLLVGLSVASSQAGGVFKVQQGLPNSESQRAFATLKQRGFGERAGGAAQIVFTDRSGVRTPEVKTASETR